MGVREGWVACNLKDKLRALKITLKVWNNAEFDNLDFKIKVCSDKLQEFELKVESASLS